jgi:hypothetical protein
MKFAHFGPAHDKTKPAKLFQPVSNFQPILGSNEELTNQYDAENFVTDPR